MKPDTLDTIRKTLAFAAIFMIGVLILFHLQNADGTQKPGAAPKYKHPDRDAISLQECRDQGLTTTANFKMRGADQILELKCGTEKIPND